MPCLPTAFAIAEHYEETLYSLLMANLVGLLPYIISSKDEAAQEDDMLHLITWYASYRREFGRKDSGIDFLVCWGALHYLHRGKSLNFRGARS